MLSLKFLGRAGGVVLALALSATPVLALQDSSAGSIQARRRSCTPGYTPCIPNRATDVDCAAGSGNGPRYTARGVTYRVTGSDRYRLDADNDGWGCER